MLLNQEFGPKFIFSAFGIEITESVVVTWIVMAILIVFAIFASRKKDEVPGSFQNFVELLVESINNLVVTTMGKTAKSYAPYIGTLALYIALSNIMGLFGIRPPTADVNTTMGLAVMTFVLIHASGIRAKKLKHFKSLLEPMPFLLPLNILSELATPISLGFRLFGNIVGGMIIMSLVYGALGYFALIPVPAALHVYFDLFSGLLQSFIFVMLTMVFVTMARE